MGHTPSSPESAVTVMENGACAYRHGVRECFLAHASSLGFAFPIQAGSVTGIHLP